MEPTYISYIENALTASYMALAYFAPLATLEAAHFFGQRIRSQEELEGVVLEEGKKLGMNIGNIRVELTSSFGAVCDKIEEPIDDRLYNLRMGRKCLTKMQVKHELRHINRGHCDWQPKNPILERLDYWFRREPQAVLYATFGLKL